MTEPSSFQRTPDNIVSVGNNTNTSYLFNDSIPGEFRESVEASHCSESWRSAKRQKMAAAPRFRRRVRLRRRTRETAASSLRHRRTAESAFGGERGYLLRPGRVAGPRSGQTGSCLGASMTRPLIDTGEPAPIQSTADANRGLRMERGLTLTL
jgi:hypothetical protein